MKTCFFSRMPLKFLHFPYLVQEKIFKEMTYPELFLMSVLSSRTKKSIQRVRFNIEKLHYTFVDNGRSLHLSTDYDYRIGHLATMDEYPDLKKRDTCLVKIGDLEMRTK